MDKIESLLSEIIEKRNLKKNRDVLTIRNRLTHEIKKVKIDGSKLIKLDMPGWFWSSELDGYLLTGNKDYYPGGMVEKRCGMMDKNCWVVLQGYIPC